MIQETSENKVKGLHKMLWNSIAKGWVVHSEIHLKEPREAISKEERISKYLLADFLYLIQQLRRTVLVYFPTK